MSELYDKIVSQRGSIERLMARIPGFKGYQEKEARRQADSMLRAYLSGELQKRVDRLVRLENRILDKIGMAPLTATRDAKTVMQHYVDRVKTAAPKYDGMWATMKIGPDDLEKIYSFDEAQVQYVDKFDAALDALEAAIAEPDTLDGAIEGLHTVATEAHDAFDLRDEVLTNLSKTV